MKRRNNRIMFMVLLALGIVFFYSMKAYAAPQNTMPIPKINISVDNANNPMEYVDNIKLLIMLTVLTLLPSFIVMMTSFVRTIVVFGFLRNAMGTQQSPPNQVMIGLALFFNLIYNAARI